LAGSVCPEWSGGTDDPNSAPHSTGPGTLPDGKNIDDVNKRAVNRSGFFNESEPVMTAVKRIIFAGMVTGVVWFASCGKKTAEPPVIIYGSDTLTTGRVALLDPPAAGESVRLRNVGIRILCAAGLPKNGNDSLIGQFSERLLLVTGVEWGNDAAALLLNAALKVHATLTDRPCATIARYTDSLQTQVLRIVKGPTAAAPVPVIKCDSSETQNGEMMVRVLQALLGAQPDLARLMLEFIEPASENQKLTDSSNVKAIISGLVSKPGAGKPDTGRKLKTCSTPPSVQKTAKIQDNSAAVLRFRDQESIRDSIEKHIPDLTQMYKKSLKSGSAFSGKIVVTIRVNAAGEVTKTTIKATDIDNKLFLDPFIGYLRTIRFKPVAEKLGSMTFDFPFEFNAEM
jgi:hypothetical protein